MSSFDDHQTIVIVRATANMTPGCPNDVQSKSRCNGTRPTLTAVATQSTTTEIVITCASLRVPFFPYGNEWSAAKVPQLGRYLLSLARLPVAPVNGQVTGTADHEGLASSGSHDLYPQGLGTSALHVQIAKCADVVDLNILL